MSKFYWRTRTGEIVDIDKMSVSHLRNALKMVVKYYGQPLKQEQNYIHNSAGMSISQENWDAHFDGPFSYIDPTEFYD